MLDVVFVITVLLFVVVCLGYVLACDKLMKRSHRGEEEK